MRTLWVGRKDKLASTSMNHAHALRIPNLLSSSGAASHIEQANRPSEEEICTNIKVPCPSEQIRETGPRQEIQPQSLSEKSRQIRSQADIIKANNGNSEINAAKIQQDNMNPALRVTSEVDSSELCSGKKSDKCDGFQPPKCKNVSTESLNVVSLTEFYSIIGGSKRGATEIFYYGDKGAYIHSRNMAAAFAIAVTVQTPPGCGWLARNGDESIFKILYRIYPEVLKFVQTRKILDQHSGFLC